MAWKLSFLIGVPSIALVLVIAIVLTVLIRRWADDGDVALLGIGGTWLFALFIAVPVFFMTAFPVNAEYLQWRPVDGTIQSIDKRLIGGDGGMSERYVVSIDGYDVPYSIDDTRAATLREGDDVSLMCTREWQWAAVDGYACRWNQ